MSESPHFPDVVYNTHLEIVHSSILPSTIVDKDASDRWSVNYTSFGGPKEGETLSRAEESAIQSRVRAHGWLNTLLCLMSTFP